MIIAKQINENLKKFSINKNISYKSKITKFDGKIIECDAFPSPIGTVCKINCTNGLLPIKCESILKILSLKTEVILIKKCWVKKTIKNTPESAMAIFLPIEELKSFFIIKS